MLRPRDLRRRATSRETAPLDRAPGASLARSHPRGTIVRCVALTMLLGGLAACTDAPGDPGAGPTDASTVAGAPASDGGSSDGAPPAPSPVLAIPTVQLVTDPPAAVPGTDGAPEIPQDALVTRLSEQLSGNVSTTVQTVVCVGALPLRAGASTDCTATLRTATRTSEQDWHAYPTRNPDGSAAVLFLSGDPLSEEFSSILGTDGTAVVTGSVDAAFGSDDVDGADVLADAQQVLRANGSPLVLDRCEGTLTFTAFDPVSCAGSANGAPSRAVVLPGSFLAAEPGLVVVTVPGA